MKTWKKIEETKKRTNDISNLKKRNEEKVQKVNNFQFWYIIKLIYIIFRKSSIYNWIKNKKGNLIELEVVAEFPIL